LADATEEERTYKDKDSIGGLDTCLGGELIMKFEDPNGKNLLKRGSAHIVKKTTNGYAAMTSRCNLNAKSKEGGDWATFTEGFFYLQLTEDNTYLARWKFTPDNIKHHTTGDEFVIEEGFHNAGHNLSCIELHDDNLDPKNADAEIPDVPALEETEDDQLEPI